MTNIYYTFCISSMNVCLIYPYQRYPLISRPVFVKSFVTSLPIITVA